MNATKKIIISAFIGSDNVGDEAVLMSILSTAGKNIGNVEITLLSIDKIKTRNLLKKLSTYNKTDDIQVINSKNISSTLKAICECDIFVCGGGGLLQDQSSMFNIPYHLWKLFVAKLFRKKIMFYAIGAGPINTWIGKRLTSKAIAMADSITVRDVNSYEILQNLNGKTENMQISTDPAINLPMVSKNEIDNIFSSENIPTDKPLIGVCLRHWFDTYKFIPVSIVKKLNLQTKENERKYNEYIINISHALDAILDNNDANILFIPFWPGRDDKIHRDVIKNMKHVERTYNITNFHTPDEIKGIISKLNILLGMRLHSLILASSMGIPFVGITYAPKVQNFLDDLLGKSYVENIAIKVDDFDDAELISKLNYVISNHQSFEMYLCERMEAARNLEAKNSSNLMSVVRGKK